LAIVDVQIIDVRMCRFFSNTNVLIILAIAMALGANQIVANKKND